jgi:hypothetical protein
MRPLNIVTLLLAGSMAMSPHVGVAHHSFAMFDRDKQITLEGEVKEFQWTNPHIFIQIMVKNEQGVVEEWSVEGPSPNMLYRRGWTHESFKPGDRVVLTVNPLKDGRRGANFVFARFPDGRTLGDMSSKAPG